MTFNEAVAAVLAKVKRPDKLAMVRSEINAALLYYSRLMDHEQDLIEHTYTGTLGYAHTIALSGLTRFRKVDWIRYPGTRIYIKKLDSRVLGCEVDVRDKWYIVGDSLKVNLAREATTFEISYYSYPPLLSDSVQNFWQLNDNWPAVVEKAAAVIFNDIGDADSARKADAQATLHFLAFSGDHTRGH